MDSVNFSVGRCRMITTNAFFSNLFKESPYVCIFQLNVKCSITTITWSFALCRIFCYLAQWMSYEEVDQSLIISLTLLLSLSDESWRLMSDVFLRSSFPVADEWLLTQRCGDGSGTDAEMATWLSGYSPASLLGWSAPVMRYEKWQIVISVRASGQL